mmetsp:Transcript_13104/g.17996  ORF Transcript_13104/g.17996 Transcript_13104/m.17996 type:complete len:268 (-) Transcript_13104:166-969(-)
MGRLTDEEILQKKLAEAYETKTCTFIGAKFQSIEQDNYHCATCTKDKENPFIICFSCYACHRQHNVIKLKKSTCICRCGREYYEHSLLSKTQNEENTNENVNTTSKQELCKCSLDVLHNRQNLFLKEVYLSKFLPFPFEMVKQILSYLSGFDLTRLQRVNKTARTLVSMLDQNWRAAYGKDFSKSNQIFSKSLRNRLKKKHTPLERSARDSTITWQEAYKNRIQLKMCNTCKEILKHDSKAKCEISGKPHVTEPVYKDFIAAMKYSK